MKKKFILELKSHKIRSDVYLLNVNRKRTSLYLFTILLILIV